MSLKFISLDNYQTTFQKHISLTGADHCNFMLSKNSQFEKDIQ